MRRSPISITSVAVVGLLVLLGGCAPAAPPQSPKSSSEASAEAEAKDTSKPETAVESGAEARATAEAKATAEAEAKAAAEAEAKAAAEAEAKAAAEAEAKAAAEAEAAAAAAAAKELDDFVAMMSSVEAIESRLLDGKLAYGQYVIVADWGWEEERLLLCTKDLHALLTKTVGWAGRQLEWARAHEALGCLPADERFPARCALGSDAEGGVYLLLTPERKVQALVDIGDLGNDQNTIASMETELDEVGVEMLATLDGLRAAGKCMRMPKRKR